MKKLSDKEKTFLIKAAHKQLHLIDKLLDAARLGKFVGNNYSDYFIDNIVQFIGYYRAITLDKFKKAQNIQDNMDTSVRDGIPSEIFDIVDALGRY